jgi:site-specific DNA-methyltransferase (adenine-specific)
MEEDIKPNDSKPLKISLKDIIVAPGRGRTDFSEIMELMQSIAAKGLLHPLVVRPLENGKYELLAGERRFRSVTLLGWKEVSCSVKQDVSDLSAKEIELEENLKRKNLSWQEECTLLEQIDTLKRTLHGSGGRGSSSGWTQDQTAQVVGQSPGNVSKKIKLAKILKDRPDIADKVKNLPISAALGAVEKHLKVEEVDRKYSQGLLKLKLDILEIDAREGLKTLEENSVDLIITDPPYGMDVLEAHRGKKSSSCFSQGAGLLEEDNSTEEKVKSLLLEIIPELARVLKPGSHLYMFFNFELFEFLRNTLKASDFIVTGNPLIWIKNKTTTACSGFNYARSYEGILYCIKPALLDGRLRRLGDDCRDTLEFPVDHFSTKVHPFQKPVSLLSKLVCQSSHKGELVLDPFAGSGSTLIAARSMERSALGFELSSEHIKQARLLLSQQGAEKDDKSKS